MDACPPVGRTSRRSFPDREEIPVLVVTQADVLKPPLIHSPEVGQRDGGVGDRLAGIERDFCRSVRLAVSLLEKLSQLAGDAFRRLPRLRAALGGGIHHGYRQRVGFAGLNFRRPLLAQIEEQADQMLPFWFEDLPDLPFDGMLFAHQLSQPILECVGKRRSAITRCEPLLQRTFPINGQRCRLSLAACFSNSPLGTMRRSACRSSTTTDCPPAIS